MNFDLQLRNLDADRETKEKATSIRDRLFSENSWCVKNLSHQKYRHQESAQHPA